MKLFMKPRTYSYFLIAAMAVACSAYRGPEAKENVLANALTPDSIAANPTATQNVATAATSLILQSKDGGQTWQDISQGLPEQEQPQDFFAGEAALYLRVHDEMYRSKSNLETPVWEKENVLPDLKLKILYAWPATSIVFNRSGVMGYNYQGQIYQQTSSGSWLPIYTNFENHTMRTIFETSDGTLLIGTDNGMYKSADKGENWKHVQNGSLFMDMVESDGVLIAISAGGGGTRRAGELGIIRSTDNGEHWESVISEGGVGIAVERIEGGFAAISYSHFTKSRRIRISMDSGKTWTAIDEGLPPSLSISSIKQIGKYLICGHPDGIFRSSDMGKTWKLVHPSVDNAINLFRKTSNVGPSHDNRKVFKLYVSGNVLYAVARNFGC
jgi:photosystem II stability/assembly factor-like uncharacterized protein